MIVALMSTSDSGEHSIAERRELESIKGAQFELETKTCIPYSSNTGHSDQIPYSRNIWRRIKLNLALWRSGSRSSILKSANIDYFYFIMHTHMTHSDDVIIIADKCKISPILLYA